MSCEQTVAVLYVERGGVYWDLPGVDAWDEERDARLYAGPWPVVAHPPCAAWGRLAGFRAARFGLPIGEDDGCFDAALEAVWKYGGVIEHPAYSKAWDYFRLPKPKTRHGWTYQLGEEGASCYVEQGRYGHAVKKATWLYAHGVELPELRWGYIADCDVRDGSGGDTNHGSWKQHRAGSKTARTPIEFRDVLLAMARSVYKSSPLASGGPVKPSQGTVRFRSARGEAA